MMKPKVCDECSLEVSRVIQEVKDEMLTEEGATYISGWEDACDRLKIKLLGDKQCLQQ